MKILHVFDCAASACLIAREQRKAGYESKVTSYALMDPFGFLSYYGEDMQEKSSLQWVEDVMNRQVPKYDIIHIHFVWQLIPHIRRMYPDKKIIMHFQGSDARQFPNDKERLEAQDMADAVMYSIGDIKHLVRKDAKRFYAPIDSELFKPRELGDKKLLILTQPQQIDKDKCLDFIDSHDFGEVQIMDRTKQRIEYFMMPSFLSQFGTYIDIRYQDGKVIDDWSSTAEQCLNMGMEVIDWNGKVNKNLPSIYKSENIMSQIEDVYESLFK